MNLKLETTILVPSRLVAPTPEADFLLFAMDRCVSSATMLILTISAIMTFAITHRPRAAMRVKYKTLPMAHGLESINGWLGETMGLRSTAALFSCRVCVTFSPWESEGRRGRLAVLVRCIAFRRITLATAVSRRERECIYDEFQN